MLNFTISTSGSVGVSIPKICYPNYEKCDINLNIRYLYGSSIVSDFFKTEVSDKTCTPSFPTSTYERRNSLICAHENSLICAHENYLIMLQIIFPLLTLLTGTKGFPC